MGDAYATAFKLLTLGFSVIPSGGGDKATWQGIRCLTDDERVNGVNQVNDFSESLLREASTRKTLHKIVNLVNLINPTSLDNPDTGELLPDCPGCGRNEWIMQPDSDLLCPCGNSLKGGEL